MEGAVEVASVLPLAEVNARSKIVPGGPQLETAIGPAFTIGKLKLLLAPVVPRVLPALQDTVAPFTLQADR